MQRSPVFLANRKDRLGARLTAIANAYFLSTRFEGTFQFDWTPRRDLNSPESIFRKNFLEAHLVKKIEDTYHLPIKLNSPAISDIICTYRLGDLQDTQLINHPFGIYAETWDATDRIRFAISELIKSKVLAGSVINAYNVARDILPEQYVSVHLRRGDLVEWLQEPNNRAEPFFRYNPTRTIERLVSMGKKPVIFTDSPEELDDTFAELSVRALVQEDNYRGLNPTQCDLLDILLIGGGSKIYAGKSAYSSFASVIGGGAIVHPMEFLGARDYFETFSARYSAPFVFNDDQKTTSLIAAMAFLIRSQPEAKIIDDVAEIFEEQFPSDSRLFLQKGHMNMRRGLFSNAAQMFEQSLRLLATEDAYAGLSRALHGTGNTEERNRVILEAKVKFPDAMQISNLLRHWGLSAA